ncbi:MAG: calcium/sodium antiporter [Planctomycetes bacterium]|nr:calcium/sodium antiporter [Planctomycetota bacterium]
MPHWAPDYPLLAILAGLVALVVGADLLVRGAVWIALSVGMSHMSVGLTLVAMGTSMPELMVSLTAAQKGSSEIAMANVIGSNVANVLLIVGSAAALCAIRLQVRWFELVFLLLATALACLPFVFGAEMSRPIAGTMVVMLVLFCGLLLRREREHAPPTGEALTHRTTVAGWALHLLLLGLGLLLLAYGSDWLVDGAVAVATSLGLSQAVVGMTVVAVGTSLPELATSTVAALRKQPGIAIGNVVGSNIFNVGAVLGIAALIRPFPVDTVALSPLIVATVLSAVALVAVLRIWRGVPRPVGFVFLIAYFGFLAREVLRSQGT